MGDLKKRVEEHAETTEMSKNKGYGENEKRDVTAKEILKSCVDESYLYMGDNVTGHC